MKWHNIEIDDDVFQYLKKMAEPFEDTPNSVLRRELLKIRRQVTGTVFLTNTKDESDVDSFPIGTPIALQQILEVIRLVKRGTHGREDATRLIAKKRNVAPQTVQDKYGRQLGITAVEFDRLLAPQRSNDLITLLIKRFPQYGDIIRKANR